MTLKTTIAAGLAASTLSLFAGSAAEARTNVVIGIGTEGWGYGYNSCWGYPRRCGWAPGHYDYRFIAPPRPVVVYNPSLVVRRNISCAAARNIVDGSSFNGVSARDCSGSVYSFRARKNGYNYRVDVNARNGNIIGTRRY